MTWQRNTRHFVSTRVLLVLDLGDTKGPQVSTGETAERTVAAWNSRWEIKEWTDCYWVTAAVVGEFTSKLRQTEHKNMNVVTDNFGILQ